MPSVRKLIQSVVLMTGTVVQTIIGFPLKKRYDPFTSTGTFKEGVYNVETYNEVEDMWVDVDGPNHVEPNGYLRINCTIYLVKLIGNTESYWFSVVDMTSDNNGTTHITPMKLRITTDYITEFQKECDKIGFSDKTITVLTVSEDEFTAFPDRE